MNRYFGMPPDKAAISADVMILISGFGMILGGYIVDHVSRGDNRKRLQVVMVYRLLSATAFYFAQKTLPATPMTR
jgi:hypothetical protein